MYIYNISIYKHIHVFISIYIIYCLWHYESMWLLVVTLNIYCVTANSDGP